MHSGRQRQNIIQTNKYTAFGILWSDFTSRLFTKSSFTFACRKIAVACNKPFVASTYRVWCPCAKLWNKTPRIYHKKVQTHTIFTCFVRDDNCNSSEYCGMCYYGEIWYKLMISKAPPCTSTSTGTFILLLFGFSLSLVTYLLKIHKKKLNAINLNCFYFQNQHYSHSFKAKAD